jgi:hypothetical protein
MPILEAAQFEIVRLAEIEDSADRNVGSSCAQRSTENRAPVGSSRDNPGSKICFLLPLAIAQVLRPHRTRCKRSAIECHGVGSIADARGSQRPRNSQNQRNLQHLIVGR